jgi:hypothetical protein
VALPQLLFDDADIACRGDRAEVSFDAEGHALKTLVCLD